jgi:hypothetical protein
MTLFPEWDSLFLDLATQDPEKVIIEFTQKKTRRGWGHQAGSYVDSISSSGSTTSEPAAAPNTPRTSPSNNRPQGKPGNYLAKASWKAAASTADDSADAVAPKKTGVQGNYLEALSQQKPKLEEEKPEQHRRQKRTGRKTRKERELLKLQMTAAEQEKEELPSSSPKLLVGSRGGYLETLLSNTIEGTSEPLKERSENPHMEEVS